MNVPKWCRKVLEERNMRSSDNSFYFRIYIIVLGVYASLRLVVAMLLKLPACHTLSEMSDQSFFQFFKWIYQVRMLETKLFKFTFSAWFLKDDIHCFFVYLPQERYYVGRGLYEKPSDYCRFITASGTGIFTFLISTLILLQLQSYFVPW